MRPCKCRAIPCVRVSLGKPAYNKEGAWNCDTTTHWRCLAFDTTSTAKGRPLRDHQNYALALLLALLLHLLVVLALQLATRHQVLEKA